MISCYDSNRTKYEWQIIGKEVSRAEGHSRSTRGKVVIVQDCVRRDEFSYSGEYCTVAVIYTGEYPAIIKSTEDLIRLIRKNA